jgi:hypothetical protein
MIDEGMIMATFFTLAPMAGFVGFLFRKPTWVKRSRTGGEE